MKKLQCSPKRAFLITVFLFSALCLFLSICTEKLFPAAARLLRVCLVLFGGGLSINCFSAAYKTRIREGISSMYVQALLFGLFTLSAAVILMTSVFFSIPGFVFSAAFGGLLCLFSVFCTVLLYMQLFRSTPKTIMNAWLLILGCSITPDGISRELVRRLNLATEIFHYSDRTSCFILCGGDTMKTGTSEAEHMFRYLLAKSVPSEQMIREEASLTTTENFRNAVSLLPDPQTEHIFFLTSDYHVLRSALCAQDAGLSITGLGCRTPWYRVLPCCLRETIAWISRIRLPFAFLFLIVFILFFLA